MIFRNREDAGHRLAQRLEEEEITADLVLAIPRGGVPLGRIIADRLGIPLDVMEARKIGAPFNPELAVGAVAAGGTVWLNEELIRELGIGADYVEQARQRESEKARENVRRLRGSRPEPEIRGRSVVLVDDGVATGATLHACIRQVRSEGARQLILAVPVAPPETLRRMKADLDRVVCLQVPYDFGAVGQFYQDFRQISDEETLSLLYSTEHRLLP